MDKISIPFSAHPDREVGYALATSRRGADLELAFFVPYVGEFIGLADHQPAPCLRLQGSWCAIDLAGLSAEVLAFVRTHPEAVIFIGVDGLSQPGASATADTLLGRPPASESGLPAGGHARLNGFLSRALRRGNLDMHRHRVGVRQSDVEAFLRKTLRAIAVARQSSGAQDDLIVDMSSSDSLTPFQDVPSSGAEGQALRDGRINLAEAIRARSGTSALTAELTADRLKSSAVTQSAGADQVFAMARALSLAELSRMISEPAGFWRHAASAALALHGHSLDEIPAGNHGVTKELLTAVDSVFVQSFADVYALSVCASLCPRTEVLRLVDAVKEMRIRGEDAGEYSLAPLSYDTVSALEILRSHVELGLSLGGPLRAGVWLKALWMASEGTAVWLERHGVNGFLATTVGTTVEAICLDIAKPNLERIAEELGV
ncbi:MAG: hypothetical protein O9327_03135 [Polaromonas sp.]|nr:hypothetical protein [Polaromonas sp.]